MKILKLFGKILLGILGVILLAILAMTIWNLINTASETKEYADFGERITVDGKSMNTLTMGEGEPTIVMLAGMGTFSPITDFTPLAEKISQTNRVVILEYFGYGFSDDTDKPRTNANIAAEVHEALSVLGVSEPVVLMAHSLSGIYALEYVKDYPDDVAGLIGIDPSVPNQPASEMYVNNATRVLSDITDVIGLTRMALSDDYLLFAEMKASGNYDNEDVAVMRAAVSRKSTGKADVSEINLTSENLNSLKGTKYPETLPVLNFISNNSIAQYAETINADEPGWLELHEEMITDPAIQKDVRLDGNHFLYWTNVDTIAEQTQEFLSTL